MTILERVKEASVLDMFGIGYKGLVLILFGIPFLIFYFVKSNFRKENKE